MTKTKQVALHLPTDFMEHLKQRAIDETYKRREFVNINTLVREALEQLYPMTKGHKETK